MEKKNVVEGINQVFKEIRAPTVLDLQNKEKSMWDDSEGNPMFSPDKKRAEMLKKLQARRKG